MRPEFVRDGEGGSLVRCERCDGNGAICGYLGEMWHCEACEGFGLVALPIDPAIVERNEELFEDYMCEFYNHVEDDVRPVPLAGHSALTLEEAVATSPERFFSKSTCSNV